MMLPAELPPPDVRSASLYSVVMEQAAQASTGGLVALLLGALVGGVLVLLGSVSLWPVSALCGTVSAIALWGLVAHASVRHPRRLLVWLQRGLVGVGTALAVVGALALFYWILGPRWNL